MNIVPPKHEPLRVYGTSELYEMSDNMLVDQISTIAATHVKLNGDEYFVQQIKGEILSRLGDRAARVR